MSLIERAINQQQQAPKGLPGDASTDDSALTEPPAGLASLASHVANTVQTAPVQVCLDHLRARGFVVPDGPANRSSEEFRVIKRPLIANAFGMGAAPVKNGKRVMVSSAFPGEGKSFCALNLAFSIAAERDHQVMLIDADVARPSIPNLLGFKAGAGLMDLILQPDQYRLRDLVLQTDIDKLAILPAGRRHAHATELLASQNMHQLLDQLTTAFPDRILIFDSPPLLATTESRVLARHMGQIVLVVEAARTPQAALLEALSTIDGAAEVVGVVLNKSTGMNTGGYGYYGYGTGYATGYGHGHNQAATA